MFKVDKRYSNATVQKTIRFTDEIYKELEKISQKENISFNALVLQCCNYAINSMEKDKNEKDSSE